MNNYELIDNYEFENALMIQERINQLETSLKQYPGDKFLMDQIEIAHKELDTVKALSKTSKVSRTIQINVKDYSMPELATLYGWLNKFSTEDDRFTYVSTELIDQKQNENE